MEDVSETPKDNIEEMEHSNKLTLNPKTGLMSDGSKVRIFNRLRGRKINCYFSFLYISSSNQWFFSRFGWAIKSSRLYRWKVKDEKTSSVPF